MPSASREVRIARRHARINALITEARACMENGEPTRAMQNERRARKLQREIDALTLGLDLPTPKENHEAERRERRSHWYAEVSWVDVTFNQTGDYDYRNALSIYRDYCNAQIFAVDRGKTELPPLPRPTPPPRPNFANPLTCINCRMRQGDTHSQLARRTSRLPYVALHVRTTPHANALDLVHMCQACYIRHTTACLDCGQMIVDPGLRGINALPRQYNPECSPSRCIPTDQTPLVGCSLRDNTDQWPHYHAVAQLHQRARAYTITAYGALLCADCSNETRHNPNHHTQACPGCNRAYHPGEPSNSSASPMMYCFPYNHTVYLTDSNRYYAPRQHQYCPDCWNTRSLPTRTCRDCGEMMAAHIHRGITHLDICPACIINYTQVYCRACDHYELVRIPEGQPRYFPPARMPLTEASSCHECRRGQSVFAAPPVQYLRSAPRLPKGLLAYHQGKQHTRFLDSAGKWTTQPKPNTEYVGIELEAYAPHLQHAYDVEDEVNTDATSAPTADLYTAERDGSIWPGMELCSMPAAPEHWHLRKNMRDSGIMIRTLAEITRHLRDKGYRCHNAGRVSCGMHVSVPRDTLTPLRMYRLISLVHSNRDLFLCLSQRRPADLAQWTDIPSLDAPQQKAIAGKKGSFPSRYVWLNLSRHRAEFRLFRANLRPERIAKNLETVSAMLDWSKSASLKYAHEGAAFLDYVQEHEVNYPNLCQFIKDIAPRIAASTVPNAQRSPILNIGPYHLAPFDPFGDDE